MSVHTKTTFRLRWMPPPSRPRQSSAPDRCSSTDPRSRSSLPTDPRLLRRPEATPESPPDDESNLLRSESSSRSLARALSTRFICLDPSSRSCWRSFSFAVLSCLLISR